MSAPSVGGDGAGADGAARERIGDARRRGPAERAVEIGVALLLTVLVAAAGTVAHRLESGPVPVGVLLAIALALTTAVVVRALAGTAALVLYGTVGILVVLLMTYWGPGGDVLVTSTPRAMLWILTMPIAAAVGWAAPRSWFTAKRVRLTLGRPRTADEPEARPPGGAAPSGEGPASGERTSPGGAAEPGRD